MAGALVSCKIRNIADVEPALRSFAHQKMIKVALAACVFSVCSLTRAYVMFREALYADAPPLSPLTYLTLAVEVPELLPTLAALVVLRRRPIALPVACAPCVRWSEGCSPCLAFLCCRGDDGNGRHVNGVDRTPLVRVDREQSDGLHRAENGESLRARGAL